MPARKSAETGGRSCPRCSGTGTIPDDRAMGAQMRARRKAAGLSLYDLAKKLDLTASYLCDLELGRRQWSVLNIRRYEEGLA